jgi:hypothetical protein
MTPEHRTHGRRRDVFGVIYILSLYHNDATWLIDVVQMSGQCYMIQPKEQQWVRA